jgi:putative ABC transport system permease protein
VFELDLAGSLLLIAGAGIMNSLGIATRERTREIGALRAIGMQRAAVASLFLIEAALFGLLGAVAGSLLGVALVAWINAAAFEVPMAVRLFVMLDTLHLWVEPSTLLLGTLGMVSATCLAALSPALRAAQRRAVAAMAHFG